MADRHLFSHQDKDNPNVRAASHSSITDHYNPWFDETEEISQRYNYPWERKPTTMRATNFSNLNGSQTQNITAKGPLAPSSNGTEFVEGFDRLAIFQLMCFPIISFAGLIGNVLICFAVFKRRRLRIIDVFILNLAATDLGTCVVSVPFDFIEILAKQWPFGTVLCKTVYPLQTILMAVSVYTLLFMSWERHRSVMPPLKPKLKAKRAFAVILMLWIACVSLVGPFIAILRVEIEDGKAKCTENWPGEYHPKVFTLAVFIVLYVLPLFVITASYIKISQKLLRDIQRMRKAIGGDKKGNVKKPLTQARAHRNMRIVKIFVIVVIVFSLCMLPNHVMWIWHDFGSGQYYQYFDTIIVFCYILVYSNSAINPFIFVFLHRRYCKDIFRNPCDGFKALVSCVRTAEREENSDKTRKQTKPYRERTRRKKKRAPNTKQAGFSPHKHYTMRKEFWNNYWRQELIPKFEARNFDRALCSENAPKMFHLIEDHKKDIDQKNDDRVNVLPQATRKVRVNFGEVVHIADERLILQGERESVM